MLIDQYGAQLIYGYTPMLTYPFPATYIPCNTLNALQKKTISILLSAMGYSQHTPRAVVFAPLHFQSQTTLYWAGSIGSWTDTTIGKIYGVVLDTYQFVSGLSTPILESTKNLHYTIGAPLTDSIRAFFHTQIATIEIKKTWTIQSERRRMLETYWLA